MAALTDIHDPVVIAAARRTPIGSFQGALAGLSALQLGGIAIRALGVHAIDEVFMGQVLAAGSGQAPARQAALAAGIPEHVPCTAVSKVCGSGMKAVTTACDAIAAGSLGAVIAGGMESMSNAPYLLPKARGGLRLGHSEVIDHMFRDGLEDAGSGWLMGRFAEDLAAERQITRDEQDDFAASSLARALAAAEAGDFAAEIAAVDEPAGRARAALAQDEQPRRSDPAKIRSLKPAFREGGTVTAANASSISDGAAALLLMRLSEAERRGLSPLARVAGHAAAARSPAEFTLAPIDAVRRLTARLGWDAASVDLYEINEAFAVVVIAAMRELGLPDDKVNIYGGACALGHPIGASGARILVTLVHAMVRRKAKRGIATLCIGGGEALAVGLESLGR